MVTLADERACSARTSRNAVFAAKGVDEVWSLRKRTRAKAFETRFAGEFGAIRARRLRLSRLGR